MAKKELELDLGLDFQDEPETTISDDHILSGGRDPFQSTSSTRTQKPAKKTKLGDKVWERKVFWIDEVMMDKLQRLADRRQKRRTGRGNTSQMIRELIEDATRNIK